MPATQSNTSLKGRIHSVESFATLDGRGIRYLIFFQGCDVRCLYCANPDTWNKRGGTEVTVGEMLEKIKKCIPYMQASAGGVTLSGGEPLLQPEFASALLREVKKLGLHTAIDTSGCVPLANAKKVLAATDHVLLCLKHPDQKQHQIVCGKGMGQVLDVLKIIAAKKIPLTLRYVLVPGLTDRESDIDLLIEFAKKLPTLDVIELLPYHTLGVHKWKELGIEYQLKQVKHKGPEETKAIAERIRRIGLPVVY